MKMVLRSARKGCKRESFACMGASFALTALWVLLSTSRISALISSALRTGSKPHGWSWCKSHCLDGKRGRSAVHVRGGLHQGHDDIVKVRSPIQREKIGYFGLRESLESNERTIHRPILLRHKCCLNAQSSSDDGNIAGSLGAETSTSEDSTGGTIKPNEDSSFISSMGEMEGDPTHHSLAPKDVSPYRSKSSSLLNSESGRGWRFWNTKGEAQDGLTFSQRLRKMGLSVLLSYGFVSNMSYCITVSLAWYIFNKQTGLSPLTKGQWPKFLAVYAGFYVFNNIIRPARLTLSVVVGRYFDSAVLFLQNKCRCKKWVAIALLVFLANIVGTCTFMALGICLASTLSGVPIRAVAK